MGSTFPLQSRNGVISDAAHFWEYAQDNLGRRDAVEAYFIIHTVMQDEDLLLSAPEGALQGNINMIAGSHSDPLASSGAGWGVENFFSDIAGQSLTADILTAYGRDRVTKIYNLLLGQEINSRFAHSGRATIIFALQSDTCTASWVEDLDGKGRDIVFLHRSHRGTKIAGHNVTHVLVDTPQGIYQAYHNGPPKPVATTDVLPVWDDYLKIAHALAVQAMERREQVGNFAGIEAFHTRVSAELAVRGLSPLGGFSPSERNALRQRAAKPALQAE